jgi:hypothetical protein
MGNATTFSATVWFWLQAAPWEPWQPLGALAAPGFLESMIAYLRKREKYRIIEQQKNNITVRDHWFIRKIRPL